MSTKPIMPGPVAAPATVEPRKRRSPAPQDPHVRYFLLKPGSSVDKPELGKELDGLKRVLVEAFKTNQPFLEVKAWNAVDDLSDGGDAPKIVKREVTRP